MKYKHIDNNSDEIIIFFNGWGMDDNILKNIPEYRKDVLLLYDYNGKIELPVFNIRQYKLVYLIGWSMGVWVANQLAESLVGLFKCNIEKSIALCGSPYPVNNKYGIPLKVFDITCKGLRIAGVDKFFKKMLVDKENTLFKRPEREFMAQIDELENLKQMSLDCELKDFKWDVALVGMNDRIISPKNQIAYWEGKTRFVEEEMPHYPFEKYNNWNKILGI